MTATQAKAVATLTTVLASERNAERDAALNALGRDMFREFPDDTERDAAIDGAFEASWKIAQARIEAH